ncbi:bifunctional UDP-N-acetylglucosamine diphosphorylase/glucosamine-1-phosphate N-acetyltransferase GlmU [Orrella sp. 11846]|uniref:bifunctional UDP-N-acetylglucosamine diphosphorylase/glucosamine-1-phosphate N-acetyltransferase GlmU n=1 Tax=Orrella sp. 11846 TaxID=3409913 RepID=UPI003B5CEE57
MLSVVILAAGQGKRMQSDLPKVLHTIAAQPMLAHLLRTARQLSADQLLVVVGHGAQAVQSAFAQEADVQFGLQTEQLGTGHAVAQVADQLQEADDASVTLVLYGDVPMVQPQTLQRLIKACGGQQLALLTEFVDDPTGYGRIVRNADNQIQAIVEHKDASEAQHRIREINTGMLAAPTGALKSWLGRLRNDNAQGEYYLTDVVDMAVRDGLAVTAVHPEASYETMGVNSRQQQAMLERAWQQAQAQNHLQNGVTLMDPSRFDQRGELICGKDVVIDVGCVFEGRVVLGDRVQIGAHCVLKDVEVAADTEIRPFSHLEGAKLGAQVRVGPFVRLRPGTVLGDEVQIGNFVEVKNTTFGTGSKASHLSYLGDATLGKSVNIGAGTITCNYDGVNKFRTEIGDEAFIGSDTQLVAPVQVGAGATIGAGTTLVKDAPPNQLTVSRSKQQTIDGWERPKKK